MAKLLGAYQPHSPSSLSFRQQHTTKPLISVSLHRFHFAANSRILPLRFTSAFSSRQFLLIPPKSSSINRVSLQNHLSVSREDHGEYEDSVDFLVRLRRWFGVLLSIFPGGGWWDFSDEVNVQGLAKPVTVWRALAKMWELVAHDRWVIFAAFSTLILAAVSEIAIPHFLTASVFSAQSMEITVFRRNVRLLVLLCLTSGICRSKSCMVKSPFYLRTEQ